MPTISVIISAIGTAIASGAIIWQLAMSRKERERKSNKTITHLIDELSGKAFLVKNALLSIQEEKANQQLKDRLRKILEKELGV